MNKNLTVVLFVTNEVERLEKVLLGYNTQSFRNFEIVLFVNKDSLFEESWFSIINEKVFYNIKKIVVKPFEVFDTLIKNVETNYLIFANSKAIPRYDFVEQHVKNREEGFFLAGSVIKINQEVFNKINQENIYSGDCFEWSWLRKMGQKNNFLNNFRFSKGLLGAILNLFFNQKLTFNLDNCSVWKSDLMVIKDMKILEASKVNLEIYNLKGKQIKYSTVLIC